MINREFTEEEKNSLYYERFHHPHPRVQLKMEVLWLKSQKIPHQKICQLAGISPNTLLTYSSFHQNEVWARGLNPLLAKLVDTSVT